VDKRGERRNVVQKHQAMPLVAMIDEKSSKINGESYFK